MNIKKEWALCALGLPLVVCLLASGCAATTQRSETVVLITEEEAALPPAPEEIDRGVCDLPNIEIESPQNGGTYSPPIPVTVRFTPSATARIDLASVRIELLKLGLSKDLTERARPYIREAGIDMPGAEIPRGSYRVRISVADTSGKSCSQVVEFTIRRKTAAGS